MAVKIDAFNHEVREILREFGSNVDDVLHKCTDEVAEEAYQNLRRNPKIPQRTGEYANGFYKEKLKRGIGWKVSNEKYRISHLLEDGHKMPQGDHPRKNARKFPHYQDAQDIADTLADRVRKELGI